MLATKAQTDTSTFAYTKPLFDFDYNKPVLNILSEKNTDGMLRYSTLTGYREGVEPRANYAIYKKSGAMLVYKHNMSIEDMILGGMRKSSHVILEVKDPSKYRYDSKYGQEQEWLRKNGHCFEMMLPDASLFKPGELSPEWSKKGGTAQKELARLLGIEFGFEKRIIDVLVLVRTSNEDKIKSKGEGEPGWDHNGLMNNIDGLGSHIQSILYEADFPPMVDETRYTGLVDLDLKLEKGMSLDQIRKALQHYDLELKQEKREYEMFVIREIK